MNETRILQELRITSFSSSQEKLAPRGFINWFLRTGLQKGSQAYSQGYTSAQEDYLNDEEKINLANILVSDILAERLTWILRKAMGFPSAFEFRRNELYEERLFIATVYTRDRK